MKNRVFLLSFLLLIGCHTLPACGDTGYDPPGFSLQLNLSTERTQFHRGEVIMLTAAFLSSSPGLYKLNTDNGSRDRPWNTDTFLVDKPSGAVDPLEVYYAHEFGEAYSGGGPRFQPLTAQPIAIHFTLNEWLRFDAPGRYRISLTSHRVVDVARADTDYLRIPGHTVASNTVDLEILPDDPAWNARTLRQALPLFNSDGFDYRTYIARQEASRAMRFLGTSEAAKAMIARYSHIDDTFRYSPDTFWYSPYLQARLGLFGYPNSGAVIQEMERRIADPDFPIRAAFLADLAQVQFFAAYPRPVPRPVVYDPVTDKKRREAIRVRLLALNNMNERDRQLLVAAMPAKKGEARAISLYALVMTDYPNRDTSDHRRQMRSLLPFYDELTIIEKNSLLEVSNWSEISSPAALPLLRRVYAKPPHAVEPGAPQDYSQQETYSLALRRLIEMSPTEGRHLLLAQIASINPRVDLSTLCSLPDDTLPSLDAVLADNLERSLEKGKGDWEITSRLVQRYATSAILVRVKAMYGDKGGEWACDIQSNLLAYFLRTEPAYGLQETKRALASRKDTGCYRYLLSEVAALCPCAVLKVLTLEHLKDPDPQVAADAVKAAQMK